MNRKLIYATLSATVLASAAAGGIAYAKEQHEDAKAEATLLDKAKLSLTEAISAAEKHFGGRAIESGLEVHDGTPRFEVSVVKDGALTRVIVAADSGKVIKTAPADRDDERDE